MPESVPPIEFIVYPLGSSRPVVEFDRLLDLLNYDQLVYLNGLIASRLMSESTGENDDNEN
jgi:hypothetical protein